MTAPKLEWKPVERRDGSFTFRVGNRQHHFRAYYFTQTPGAAWSACEWWGDSVVRKVSGTEPTMAEAQASAERWIAPYVTVIP